MKNITSEKDVQDRIEILKQQSIDKQKILIGKVRPKKGHTMFEYNYVEKTIITAEFDQKRDLTFAEAASRMKSLVSGKKEITKKKNCIYVSALNKKNAFKILKRELNID